MVEKSGRASQDDLPPRFVELWIALNALYGQRTYEKRSRLTEGITFKLFMGSPESVGLIGKNTSATMIKLQKDVKRLVRTSIMERVLERPIQPD